MMAIPSGEQIERLWAIKAKIYYVLAYNYPHYQHWCRRMQIRLQGANVRYIDDDRNLRGAQDYCVILLEDYYNPNRSSDLYEFMEFVGNPRAAAVYPVPPYEPIVMEGGFVVGMRCLPPKFTVVPNATS